MNVAAASCFGEGGKGRHAWGSDTEIYFLYHMLENEFTKRKGSTFTQKLFQASKPCTIPILSIFISFVLLLHAIHCPTSIHQPRSLTVTFFGKHFSKTKPHLSQ